MNAGYWARVFRQRTITRRRALAGSLGLGGAALTLSMIGCGGSNNENKTTSDQSGLVTTPSDTRKSTKPGGTWPYYINRDLDGLDQFAGRYIPVNNGGTHVYSRLLKNKIGTRDAIPDGSAEGDAAQSFDITPDGLRVTFKLRPNMKFDQRAPTNGRALDTQDVLWSWEKFKRIATSAAEVSHEKNPVSAVESLTAPDNSTIVAKLAFPTAAWQMLFSYGRYLVIQPREGEDKIDLRQDMRGSGAWTLTSYQPSVGFEWRKNPEWYMQGLPLFDVIKQPIILEYASGLSQFKAGNIWQYAVKPEDMIATKKEQSNISLITRGNLGIGQGFRILGFSQRPGAIYGDARVRRAVSMLLDRDLWIDTFYNVSSFEKQGLPVRTAWYSHIHPGFTKYWSDPKGSELGEGAQYFKYDPAEAKKLLRAAGQSGPIETVLNFERQQPLGPRQAEVWSGFLQANGDFKITLRPLDADDWLQQVHIGQGLWEGLTSGIHIGSGPDIDGQFAARYIFGASQYCIFRQPLPVIHDLLQRQRQELDVEKRIKLVKNDIQMELAKQMPAVPEAGLAEEFDMFWPQLGNFGALFTAGSGYDPQENFIYFWDQSKKA